MREQRALPVAARAHDGDRLAGRGARGPRRPALGGRGCTPPRGSAPRSRRAPSHRLSHQRHRRRAGRPERGNASARHHDGERRRDRVPTTPLRARGRAPDARLTRRRAGSPTPRSSRWPFPRRRAPPPGTARRPGWIRPEAHGTQDRVVGGALAHRAPEREEDDRRRQDRHDGDSERATSRSGAAAATARARAAPSVEHTHLAQHVRRGGRDPFGCRPGATSSSEKLISLGRRRRRCTTDKGA